MIQSRNAILHGNSQTDQYVWSLRTMYQRPRFWNPSIALMTDAAIYEKLMEDEVVRQALDARQGRAAGDTWQIVPPRRPTEEEELLARIVEFGLTLIKNFQASRKRLASAILRGNRYAFVEGSRTQQFDMPDLPGATLDWWLPSRLKDIDGRRIRSVPPKSGEGYEFEYAQVSRDSFADGARWVPLNARRVVRAAYDDDEGRLSYGRGLADALYNLVYARSVAKQEGLAGIEKWGQGVIKMAMDPTAHNNADQGTDDVVEEAMDNLDAMRARNSFVHDARDEVDVLWPDGSSAGMVIDFLGYLDSLITRLVDGALLPSGGGAETGSLARGEVEEETIEKLSRSDRRLLEDALSEGLIENSFLAFNRENLVLMGLDKCRPPRVVLTSETREDPEKNARVVQTLQQANVPLRADEVYEKIGFTKPEPEDEILAPVQMPTLPFKDA